VLAEEKKWNVFNKNCPTRMVLDRIADKWTVLVVGALQSKTKRFGELKKEVDGVSQKMLTKTLRGMERDGLIKRKIYPTIPPKVEYSLTPLGVTLVDMLQNIQFWAENNIEKIISSQRKFDNKS
jgi:DNA-binding HxlR family transcriptional regulator